MIVFGDLNHIALKRLIFFQKIIISELVGVKGVEFGMTMGDIVGDNLDLQNQLTKLSQRSVFPGITSLVTTMLTFKQIETNSLMKLLRGYMDHQTMLLYMVMFIL